MAPSQKKTYLRRWSFDPQAGQAATFTPLCDAAVPQLALSVPEYVRLVSIRATPVQGSFEIQLLCEEDEHTEAFRAQCSSACAFYLRPYAIWLRSYLHGDSVDQPVIPVRLRNGATTFDPGTAEQDHPELVAQLNQFLNAGLVPSLGDVATDLKGLS